MPRFSYTAYDDRGARAAGMIEAETREAAVEALFRQGRYPLDLVEGGRIAAPRWWEREILLSGGAPSRGLALLTRELATLVKADLAVDEALRIAQVQPLMPGRVRQTIARVLGRVLEGASLSEAFQAEGQAGGRAFPAYYVHVVRAGEAAGTLGQTLEELAGFLERSAELRGRIGSALLYPAMLMVAAVVAVAVIMSVLIPTIAPLFTDAGVEPPFIIGFLLGLQGATASHWPLALAAVAAAAVGFLVLSRNASWRLWRDRQLLRLPLVAGLVENGQTAIVARTLATLLRNGVPMLQALEIAGDVLSNRAMAAALRASAAEVKEGAALSGALARAGLFPELALRLTAVGEQTGQLDAMLDRVGSIYEQALQRQLGRLTNLLTPVLTLAMGALVGGLLLSVMGAIASVNDLALR
jgi:general secretion pathway protein F